MNKLLMMGCGLLFSAQLSLAGENTWVAKGHVVLDKNYNCNKFIENLSQVFFEAPELTENILEDHVIGCVPGLNPDFYFQLILESKNDQGIKDLTKYLEKFQDYKGFGATIHYERIAKIQISKKIEGFFYPDYRRAEYKYKKGVGVAVKFDVATYAEFMKHFKDETQVVHFQKLDEVLKYIGVYYTPDEVALFKENVLPAINYIGTDNSFKFYYEDGKSFSGLWRSGTFRMCTGEDKSAGCLLREGFN